MLNIDDMCENARYADSLENVINNLGGKKVLRLKYESNYQGYVDIDVLLNGGSVFSYKYYYGSCSGCDDWEYRGLTNQQIEGEMIKEATTFLDLEHYEKWRNMIG